MTDAGLEPQRRLLGRRVLVVTSEPRGAGAIVRRLTAEGAQVVLGGPDRAHGERLVSRVRAAGGQASFVRAEVGTDHGAAVLVRETIALLGGLDVLVGVTGQVPDDVWTTWEMPDWQCLLAREVIGLTSVARAAFAALSDGVDAKLVIVDGLAGAEPTLAPALLAGALRGLSDGLHAEMSPSGVDVHQIVLTGYPDGPAPLSAHEQAAAVALVTSGTAWTGAARGTEVRTP